MPREDNDDCTSHSSEVNSGPVMTAVEVEPPARHRWRMNPKPNYPWLPPPPTPPDEVVFRKDIEDDDVGFQALFESLTNRQTMLFIQQGLRTIIFVTFPLFTLANHPNTMYRLGFPQLLVATVVSTSTHQGFLGNQIGMHLFILRGVIFMMLLGLFFNSWSVTQHIGAWWGLFAAAMFAANLIKHSILRRFMVLYTLIWMMEVRLSDQYFGFTEITNSCWFAADFMIGSCMGVAAMMLPVPLFIHSVVDDMFARTFSNLGKYLVSMQTFVFSANTHAAENFFSNKNPLAGIEKVLAQAPSLLWFSNWEPTEFGTRNPIRVVKLSLLRRLLALTYAAHSCGENITRLRSTQADKVAMARHRDNIRRIAGRSSECDSSDSEHEEDYGHAKHTGDDSKTGGAGGSADPSSKKAAPRDSKGNDTDDSDVSDPLYLNERFVEETRRVAGKAAADKLTADLRRLHSNSIEYATTFGAALQNCLTLIGTTESRPKKLVEAVPFEDMIAKDKLKRRNMRMETLFVRHCQAAHIKRFRQERQERQASAAATDVQQEEKNSGSYPTEDSPAHEPFRDLEGDEPFADDQCDTHVGTAPQSKQPHKKAHAKRNVSHHDPQDDPYYLSPDDAAIVSDFLDIMEDKEVFLRLNELFFHMLLSMIAGEIQTFGEMMQTYKPEHSLLYRFWTYYFVEPWFDFWNEVWNRLTMARPCDVRTLKNAVQMTCAYLSASAFNLELWKPGGVYYFFGTTIVLGMPVGEEALTQGVTRLAGNTLGCALGYLSFHNTKNLSETIGFTLCLCFICLLCQHHPVFGPCFIYGAIITLAGTPMAEENNDIMQRVLAIAWAFCAFMLCCMLIFPSSNIKILWNHRSKMVKVLSEIIDGVSDVARQPLLSIDAIEADAAVDIKSAMGPDVSVRVTVAKTNALLSQLHLNMELAKGMSGSCLSWGPIAARENMIRGSLPFPAGPSTQVQAGLQRLLAETQLLVFGVQLMHRPRCAEADPVLKKIIAGPLSDFLDEFSGMSRTWAQGFIDSLQNSRRWSYPKALNDTSYMVRLKARLRGILFLVISLMNAAMVDGTPALQQADFDDINRDALRLAAAEVGAGGAGGGAAGGAVDGPVSGANRHDSNSNNNGGNEADTETSSRHADAHNANHNNFNDNSSFASTIALDPNASFAGRYLAARRRLTEMEANAIREAARDGRLPNDTVVSVSGAPAYHHFAPLHDEKMEYRDEYPLTEQGPEGRLESDMRAVMLAQAKEKSRERTGTESEMAAPQRTPDAPPAAAGGTSAMDLEMQNAEAAGDATTGSPVLAQTASEKAAEEAGNYHLVNDNTMLGSAFRQMMVRDRNIRHYRPPEYKGPDFTYREDDLDLPVDTDFVAVVSVLTSAYDMINEMQNLMTPMATVNGYQRQLHEGSIMVDAIEKAAHKIEARQARIYARYHDPDADSEVKRPLSTIASPFHDFAV